MLEVHIEFDDLYLINKAFVVVSYQKRTKSKGRQLIDGSAVKMYI